MTNPSASASSSADQTKSPSEKIILACDRSPFADNLPILDSLKGKLTWAKVGLRSVLAEGPGILDDVSSRGFKVFLDVKLHDIPSTVSATLKNLLPIGFDMVTLHVTGGRNMIKACRDVVDEYSGDRKPLLLGVTLLTSLNHTDVRDFGVMYSVAGHVKRLAQIAQESGCDGVVASGGEVKTVRTTVGDDFLIVTPGIRPGAVDTADSDQQRVMSPSEAIALGSNFLVIGRPIHGADDPAKAFDEIAASLI